MQMRAERRRFPPLRCPAGHACAGHACRRAMRLLAVLVALASKTVQAAPCVLLVPLWRMRESARGPEPAPFPTDLHAGAGVDAGSCEQLCVANAAINSRKKSEFPLFSSMSFCKLASVAKGWSECEACAKIAA